MNREMFDALRASNPVYAFQLLQLRLMVVQRRIPIADLAGLVGVTESYMYRVLGGHVVRDEEFLNKCDDAVDAITRRRKREELHSVGSQAGQGNRQNHTHSHGGRNAEHVGGGGDPADESSI